jgi:hypothetical protein
MAIRSFLQRIRRIYVALDSASRAHPALVAFVGLVILPALLIGCAIVVIELSEAYAEYKYNHLTPAEHLQLAKDSCRLKQYGGFCVDPTGATQHLNKIPPDASEYGEASKLLEVVRLQQQAVAERQQKALAAKEAERTRLANQTRQESLEQMQRNIAGLAHDSYQCATSTLGSIIVSFDNGRYWWGDDGRCAAEEQKKQAAEQQRQHQERAIRERQQRQRDEDAQSSSYWPTTLRVDTDMDSFWLNNEERICQTLPDDKGRVARVTCSQSAAHQTHSIPVKFWGGVDRNIVSDWKCRREGDDFVCRAID